MCPSPALLADSKKLVQDYMVRTQRPDEPYEGLFQLHQIPPFDGGQSGHDASIHDHGAWGQYLHVASSEI